MKFLMILLTTASLHVNAVAISQNISIKVHRAPLKEVMEQIRKQTGYYFLYDDALLSKAVPVTLEAKNQPLDKVLEMCFANQDLNYNVMEKTIVVRAYYRPRPVKAKGILRGKVTGQDGVMLAGASVVVSGTSTGTKTDSSGFYQLTLEEGRYAITVSYVGYETVVRREVTIGAGIRMMDFALLQNKQMQEVIVSYGKQRNREITGSVAQVNAAEMQDMPVNQFAQQLQGKVAGVQISQSSGQPGRGMSFRIRGAASLASGYQPLFVIDGIPITGDISNINPAEIENFTVLKDASATSLYGSRAANGVILITTRRAKSGKINLQFNANYGVQSIPMQKVPRMMNAKEFAEFYSELYEDKATYEKATAKVPAVYANPEALGAGTNWFDAITRKAPIQSYDLIVSGGSAHSYSTAVLGYQEQQGVVVNTGTKLFSARLNQEFILSDGKLKLGFGIAPSYRLDHNNRLSTDGLAGIFQWALESSPLGKPVNADGTYPLYVNSAGMVADINPYAQLMLTKDDYKTTRILGNGYINYELIKGLQFKGNLAVDKGAEIRDRFSPSTISTTSIASGTSTAYDNYSWTGEANLQYNKSFNGHAIEALVGYSAQTYQGENNNITAQNYSTDDIPWLSAAGSLVSGSSNYTSFSLLSEIGRLNYNYRSKYLLSAAMRRDGSSRFGAERKYGNFPSLSVGWVPSEEAFLKNNEIINFLRIRASYGVTGNNNIGNYTHISGIGKYNYVVNGSLGFGSTIGSLGNTELAWERNKQLDIGFDISLLNNRISLTYDYYRKITDGMIQQRPLPRASGFSSINYNTGVFSFWGHEFTLNTNNLSGDLKWTTSLNISFDRNRIKSLVSPGFVANSTAASVEYYRNQVGHHLGEFYGFVNLGLYKDKADLDNSPKYKVGAYFSDVGTIKMKDLTGPDGVPDGVVTDADRTFIGDPTPDFSYGMTNLLNYKQFDFNITMSGAAGGKILNVVKWTHLVNLDGARGLLQDVKYRWRSEANPGNGVYARTETNTTALSRFANSQWVEDGSYLTIKNISLGYTVPLKQQTVISSLRLYASVQQAFVFSKYSGMNPEISLSGLDATNGLGVDAMSYPVPRTFSLGLNLTLK